MTRDAWHVDAAMWSRYADGQLDTVAGAAVETHVAGCARCREGAKEVVPGAEVTEIWSAIGRTLPHRQSRTGRWLRRLGVSDSDTVVLQAAGSWRATWAVAVGAALVCVMLSGTFPRYQSTSFLLLAPLVPVVAVLAAYDVTDPLRELATATAFSKLRVALLRTAAALAAAAPLTVGMGLLVPGLEALAFVWLLPGLMLTVTALVLLTWTSATRTGALVGVGWTTVVLVLTRAEALTVLQAAPAQVLFALAAACLSGLLFLRTEAGDVEGSTS